MATRSPLAMLALCLAFLPIVGACDATLDLDPADERTDGPTTLDVAGADLPDGASAADVLDVPSSETGDAAGDEAGGGFDAPSEGDRELDGVDEADAAGPGDIEVDADVPVCESDDPCQVAHVTEGGGCQLLPLSCASPNACQTAHCEAGVGCVLAAADCDDHDPHTQDWCSPDQGCVHLGPKCGDGQCDPGEHEACPGDCQGGKGECGDGVCEVEEQGHCGVDCGGPPSECGDGECDMPELWECPADCVIDLCGDEVCDPGEAFFCPLDCDAGGACNDGDRCTADWKDQYGRCHHDGVTCDDGSDCTHDACLPSTGCIYTDACADDDPCTEALCWMGHCVSTRVPWCE